MAVSKPDKLWTASIILLVIVIASGGFVLWARYQTGQSFEIVLPEPQEQTGHIYVGGAVSKPGFYQFSTNDSVDSLIQSAGGATHSANISNLELYIGVVGEGQGAQKIDINRAEVWLLEALPGIGPALAQRIIDYRQKNGLFNNTDELLKVPGIASGTYDKFKDLITVADR